MKEKKKKKKTCSQGQVLKQLLEVSGETKKDSWKAREQRNPYAIVGANHP